MTQITGFSKPLRIFNEIFVKLRASKDDVENTSARQ